MMYTVKEAAQIIGVSSSTIYRKLADITVSGQRVRTADGSYGAWYLTESDLRALKTLIGRS